MNTEEIDKLNEALRIAQTRYIRAHSAVVNKSLPSQDEWRELDEAGAEYKRIAAELEKAVEG
jgi:hypothetical protein